MGCGHSLLSSPMKSAKKEKTVVLKNKISIHRSQTVQHQISNGTKSSRFSISTKKVYRSLFPPILPVTALTLEQTLDGRGIQLIKRFKLDTACYILDASRVHILLLDGRQLRLINMKTMNMETCILPLDFSDIQEIAWSSKLDAFLILTADQLYRTGCRRLHLTIIPQIEFDVEGPRKSYMAVDGNDLLINRSFGSDIRHYSLTDLNLVRPAYAYLDNENVCVTTIRLNSNKILALAISIDKHQMIDLVNLHTNQLIHRITLNSNENVLYPVDLRDNGQWFAKTCVPCENIGHCLISPKGQTTRLTLFSHDDNFIRSLCVSPDKQWLLIARQHVLELYQPCKSILSEDKDSS